MSSVLHMGIRAGLSCWTAKHCGLVQAHCPQFLSLREAFVLRGSFCLEGICLTHDLDTHAWDIFSADVEKTGRPSCR